VEGIFLLALIFALRALFEHGKNPFVSDAADLNSLANSYAAEGHYDLAEQTFNRLIRAAQKKNGPDGIEVGIYLRRLAEIKMQRRDFAGAIPLFHRVVFIQATNLGPYSPDLLQTLNWLAQLYQGQGNLDAAIVMMRRMIEVHSAAYGDRNLHSAPVWHSLGLLHHHKGDLLSAADAFRHTLSLLESQSEPDQPELALCLSNLGKQCLCGGRTSVAAISFHPREDC